MRAKGWLAAAGALVALTAAGASHAAMTLNCQVQANRPDHGVTRWKRRIIIEPSTRIVRILDDFGRGFVPRTQYGFVSIDARRVVLEEGRGKTSYIDRQTGEYVLRNRAQGFTLRGRCSGGR